MAMKLIFSLTAKIIFIFLMLSLSNMSVARTSTATVTAPIPRSKAVKSSVSSMSFSGNIFHRIAREIKGNFCSELELLTLKVSLIPDYLFILLISRRKLTRPVDGNFLHAELDNLIGCVNAEYENPEFLVTLLAKLSRKLAEANIFTKLKSLLVLHKLVVNLGAPAREAVIDCIKSLRKEIDDKTRSNYFSTDSLSTLTKAATNVLELKASEMATSYADYVFELITLRGNLKSNAQKNVGSVDSIVARFDECNEIIDACNGGSGSTNSPGEPSIASMALVQECSRILEEDKTWLLYQLQKIYEVFESYLQCGIKLCQHALGSNSHLD